MENESSSVVSDSTESTVTDASSTASTQTEDTTSSTDTPTTPATESQQERRDYRKIQKEDADLNAHVQREIARALAKRERQQLKQTAKAAVERGDSETALNLAQRFASEPDEQDEDEAQSAKWQQSANQVKPHLDRMLRLDKDGRATNPYYVKLYEKMGQSELDKRYNADPTAFVDWLDDQMTELRVDDMLRKKAPSLYEAGKVDGQNSTLSGAPKPLGGTAAGGSKRWTVEAVGKLSSKQYLANKEQILRDLYGE